MKRNAVIGLAAAITLTVAGGAGFAAYAIGSNNHKAEVVAQVEQAKAAEQKAQVEVVTAKLAAQKKATAEAVKEKNSAELKAAAIKAADKNMAAEKAATEKAATEKAAAEKAAAEKAAAEKAAAEKATAEKEAAEKAAAEKEATEKAEKKAAAEKAAAEKEARDKASERIVCLAGTVVYPETVETGMQCSDCVDTLKDLMCGTTLGNELLLTADEPVLYIYSNDGEHKPAEYYGTIEAGVKYFTRIDVHCASTAFGTNLKLSDNLEGWSIAAINGNTVTLYSPVFITE